MTTTLDLHLAIERKFAPPEWIVMHEVRNATGFAKRERYADAVALSTYPSRGIQVLGFEVKRDRRDWTRELNNPDKAHAIAKYCDQWWIVAPKDVVPRDELPAKWGLMELKGNGLHRTVPAKPLDSVPLDRLFVASMVRSAHKMVKQAEHRSPAQQELNARWDAGYEQGKAEAERERRYRLQELERLSRRVDEFAEATGINLGDYHSAATMARAYRLGLKLDSFRHVLVGLHTHLGEFLGETAEDDEETE